MIDIRTIPVPFLMASLPRDRRGYPVPFFQFIPSTFKKDGIIDFRVTDPVKKTIAIRDELCGICGQPLNISNIAKYIFFLGGPLSAENRVFTDPAMHFVCARYAIKVCPFLNNSNYKPTDDEKQIKIDNAIVIKDAMSAVGRPDKMALFKTDGYSPVQVKDGNTGQVHPMIYAMAKPFLSIEWF